ncbi:MAG: LLM class flavin-dependent oxidoreductase [Pseudomonadota bacterium]
MHPDEFSLGLVPWQMRAGTSAMALAEQARQAESWGYRSFFLPENHFTPNVPIPDPLLILAAAAATTTDIRLGTTSWLLPIREPLLAAAQAASLDQLSNGRLILGLGRGYSADMLQAFGVPIREKRRRLDSVLERMLSAWAGEPVFKEQALVPLPCQQPHPPLWMAAFGPKAIAQAARLGLPYFASPMETLTELERNYAIYEEGLAEYEQLAPATRAIMRTVFVSDDVQLIDSVRTKLAQQSRGPLSSEQAPDIEDICVLGNAAEVAEQLAHYRSRLALNHLVAVRPRVAGVPEPALRESFAALPASMSHSGLMAATAQ